MDTDNIAVIIDLILRASAQIQAYTELVKNARAQGRDVSDEELIGLKVAYADEREEVLALIEAKRDQR